MTTEEFNNENEKEELLNKIKAKKIKMIIIRDFGNTGKGKIEY